MDDLSHPSDASPDAAPAKGPTKFVLRLAICVFAALLIVLFYAIENWRGARAWRLHREALEARRETIDWNSFLPTPPPAASNMMSEPKLAEWFIRRGPAPSTNEITHPIRNTSDSSPLGIIQIVPDGAPPLSQFIAGGEIQSRILDELVGRREASPSGFLLFVRPSAPREVRLTAAAGSTNIPSDASFTLEPLGDGKLAIVPNSTWWDAGAFLNDSENFVEKFTLVRRAAARPSVCLEGDHSRPDKIPVPNFVALRVAAQTAAARAQSHLLLQQPAEALNDLVYVENLRRITESRPTTLVAVMMGVAFKGLTIGIIESAFAQRAWTEKEWTAFLQEGRNVRIVRDVAEAMRSERAAVHAMVRQKGSMFVLLDPDEEQKKPWWKRKSLLANLMPAGWTDSGLTLYSEVMQQGIDGLNGGDGKIIPHMLRDYGAQVEKIAAGLHPRRVLTAVAVPNVGKAAERAALIETRAAFVSVAAALELHRAKTGSWPAALQDLVPTYLPEVPKDVVTAEPLRYRRLGASYILYSTGWNRYDDLAALLDKADSDPAALPFVNNTTYDADWVWRGAPTLPAAPGATSIQANR